MTLDEVLARVMAGLEEPIAAERVAVVEALDRTLAEPLLSTMDLPPWDAAVVDGFAVRSEDVAGADPANPVSLEVVAQLRPGGDAASLNARQCARVGIGSRLPEHTDAVVSLESVTDAGGGIVVKDSVAPGQGIRPRGAEAVTGQVVIGAGTRLRPGHLALAAAVGAGDIPVRRRPVACVLSVGDELRFPGQSLGPAGVPDANRPGLLTLSRRAGAWAVDIGIASDSVDAVIGALRPMMDRADVVLTTGGLGAPPYDAVTRAMETLGRVDMLTLDGLAGRGFVFGAGDPRPSDGRRPMLFGLPGSPPAAFALFELVVRPVLDRLAGRSALPRLDRGVLVESLDDLTAPTYAPVVVVRDENGLALRDELGRAQVRPTGLVGPEKMAGIAVADALAAIADNVGAPIEAGMEVEIRWLAE